MNADTKLPIGQIFYLLGFGRRFEWRDDPVPYDTATDLVHVLADGLFGRPTEHWAVE